MQIYCSLRGPGGLWLGEGWNRVFCCFWWRGVSAAGCFLPDSGMLFLAELVGLWSLEGMGNCSVHALSTVSQWWTFSYSFWGMGVVFCGPEQNFWLGRFLIWTLEVSSFENRWWPKNLENWLLANFEVRYFRFWGLNRESVGDFVLVPGAWLPGFGVCLGGSRRGWILMLIFRESRLRFVHMMWLYVFLRTERWKSTSDPPSHLSLSLRCIANSNII